MCIDLVKKKINELLEKQENVVIAIDGMCASGKTTLSKKLEEVFDANVIHCDDFYLPLNKRTEERLKEPGGNIDYERLKEEVINNLDKDFKYQVFSCKTMTYGKIIDLQHKKVTIIEGAFLDKYYDLSIFIEIEKTLQEHRILKRNGKEKIKDFNEKWIPLEDRYFKYYKIKDKCDLKLYIIE